MIQLIITCAFIHLLMHYLENLVKYHYLKKTDINDSENCGSKAVHTLRQDIDVDIKRFKIEKDSM